MKAILDGVNGSILKVIDVQLLGQAVQVDELHLLGIETTAEVILEFSDSSLARHLLNLELDGWLLDVAL